ncbi:MAG TPA: ribokinase [Candidatus Limnocylindrales bacterium]|nr:ribokinase [Candidatus Limnocylindrales bacterium]
MTDGASGRVIVVGSVNVDLVARVDHLPAAGETVGNATFDRHAGGKGGNQAVAAARLGARVAFVGAIGDDPLADEARAALAAEGIELTELLVVPGPTGVAVILVDRHGENAIAVAPGANGGLTPDVVAAALGRLAVRSGDVVLVGHEIPTATARAALAAGRRAGARTILNPAPAAGIDRSLFDLVDVLVPNRVELGQIVAADGRRAGRELDAGVAPERLASTLLAVSGDGPAVREAVVVTLGASGAIVVRPDAIVVEAIAPVVAVVDTVGAGDTFVGALAADLAADRTLEEAVRRAVVAAALSTTRVGARGGMPTPSELDEAVRR